MLHLESVGLSALPDGLSVSQNNHESIKKEMNKNK